MSHVYPTCVCSLVTLVVLCVCVFHLLRFVCCSKVRTGCVGGLDCVSCVPWLGLVRSLADHMLDHPVILPSPAACWAHSPFPLWSIRLRAVSLADVLGDDDSSAAGRQSSPPPPGRASCCWWTWTFQIMWRHVYPTADGLCVCSLVTLVVLCDGRKEAPLQGLTESQSTL